MKPDVAVCSVLGTEGHQGPLTCVATNQDGSLILTGSVDCQAKLISAVTGKVSATWSRAVEPVLRMPSPSLLMTPSAPLLLPFLLLVRPPSILGFSPAAYRWWVFSDPRLWPPSPTWEKGRRASPTLWSLWASAACECEKGLGLTRRTAGEKGVW